MRKQTTLSRISEMARNNFSHAHMSDTKWKKLFAALLNSGANISEMIVKFIDIQEPRAMRFPIGLQLPKGYVDTIEFGPIELRSIQWLDIPLVVRTPRGNNLPPQVMGQDLRLTVAILEHFKCQFEVSPDGIRILGYSN